MTNTTTNTTATLTHECKDGTKIDVSWSNVNEGVHTVITINGKPEVSGYTPRRSVGGIEYVVVGGKYGIPASKWDSACADVVSESLRRSAAITSGESMMDRLGRNGVGE